MPMPHSIDGPAEKCQHGYWLHAHERCPWCAGFTAETANVVPVRGPGNGWLLHADETPCMRCGGPGGSSSGLIPDYVTWEWYNEFRKRENLCFGCWQGVRDRPLTPAEQAHLVVLRREVVPLEVQQLAAARAARAQHEADMFTPIPQEGFDAGKEKF